MSIPETPPMTAAEHVREAERFAASAETRDRYWDRSADLQAAQVHATLAQTAVAQEYIPVLREALGTLVMEAQPEGGGEDAVCADVRPGTRPEMRNR